MGNELISVVIPLYNKERHILRALKSVCSQTYNNYEIIVIDDGSTDNGAGIVKEAKIDKLLLFQQENRGVSAARNAGINRARGQLVAFLDADDEWKHDFLETIIRLRRNHHDAGAYATAWGVSSENKIHNLSAQLKGIPEFPWEGLIDSYFQTILESDHLPICSSSVAIPLDIFQKAGMFVEGEARAEDQDMWFRIACTNKIAYSTNLCSIYHQDADNRCCNSKIEKLPSFLDTLSYYITNSRDAEEQYLLSEYLAKTKLQLAYKYMLCNEWDKSIDLLTSCNTQRFIKRKHELLLKCRIPLRWLFWLKHKAMQNP